MQFGLKGAFVAKIFFCFLSENECLDGMELVYIDLMHEAVLVLNNRRCVAKPPY